MMYIATAPMIARGSLQDVSKNWNVEINLTRLLPEMVRKELKMQ